MFVKFSKDSKVLNLNELIDVLTEKAGVNK